MLVPVQPSRPFASDFVARKELGPGVEKYITPSTPNGVIGRMLSRGDAAKLHLSISLSTFALLISFKGEYRLFRRSRLWNAKPSFQGHLPWAIHPVACKFA